MVVIDEPMEYTFFVLLQRIAKKMLLEEIKANLSSEEDASSDEESNDGKKKKGRRAKNKNNSGKHLTEKQIFERIFIPKCIITVPQ